MVNSVQKKKKKRSRPPRHPPAETNVCGSSFCVCRYSSHTKGGKIPTDPEGTDGRLRTVEHPGPTNPDLLHPPWVFPGISPDTPSLPEDPTEFQRKWFWVSRTPCPRPFLFLVHVLNSRGPPDPHPLRSLSRPRRETDWLGNLLGRVSPLLPSRPVLCPTPALLSFDILVAPPKCFLRARTTPISHDPSWGQAARVRGGQRAGQV